MLNQIERDGNLTKTEKEIRKRITSRLMMETGITLAWPS
jgi:hypothetical protein